MALYIASLIDGEIPEKVFRRDKCMSCVVLKTITLNKKIWWVFNVASPDDATVLRMKYGERFRPYFEVIAA